MNTPLQHGSHLDADLINAFAEGVLPEHERSACLAHMAGCAQCREVAFLAQQAAEAEQPTLVPAHAVEPVPFWRRWLTPLPLAGLGALACVALVFFAWHRQAHVAMYMTQTAEVHQAERPGPSAAMSALTPPPPAKAPPPPPQTLHPAMAVSPPPPANIASPSVQSAAMAGRAAPAPEQQLRLREEAKDRGALDQQAMAAAPAVPAQGQAAGTVTVHSYDRLSAGAAPKAAASLSSNEPAVVARAAPAPAAPVTAVASDQMQNLANQNRNVISYGAAVTAAPLDEGPMHLRIEHGATGNELSALTGTITDMSGAVIQNVAVTVYPLVPGGPQTAQAATDSAGRFHIAAVPAGRYRVQLTAPGFTTLTQQVDLQPHDLARLAPVMPVGAMTETVEVSAQAAQLNTESATMAKKLKAVPERGLPSNMAAATTVSSGKRALALDTTGTLFVRMGSKRWKTVKPQWPGKVIQISVAAAPDAFQLTTDSGAVLVSTDGETWRAKTP